MCLPFHFFHICLQGRLLTSFPSVLQIHIMARLVLSDPRSSSAPRPFAILLLAIGHIHRLLLSQTLVMKLSDQPIFFPPPSLSFSPTSERSPLYFSIWLLPSVSVKTISCEIENNHVERDWDGSSLSSSLSLSMDSWLLLIKSTKG